MSDAAWFLATSSSLLPMASPKRSTNSVKSSATKRLKEFLRTAAGSRAEDISSRLADTLREWIGASEQHDDLTFVVVTVN